MSPFWIIFGVLVIGGGLLFVIAGRMESSPNPDTVTASAMPGIAGIVCWVAAGLQIVAGIIWMLVKAIPL